MTTNELLEALIVEHREFKRDVMVQLKMLRAENAALYAQMNWLTYDSDEDVDEELRDYANSVERYMPHFLGPDDDPEDFVPVDIA